LATVDDFDEVLEQYHLALDEIMKGSPDGYKRLYSRRDDVTLANPFGPPVRGWDQVAPSLERAASHYSLREKTRARSHRHLGPSLGQNHHGARERPLSAPVILHQLQRKELERHSLYDLSYWTAD
jgi:hypothetical protein